MDSIYTSKSVGVALTPASLLDPARCQVDTTNQEITLLIYIDCMLI